jgi:hypothetical protein
MPEPEQVLLLCFRGLLGSSRDIFLLFCLLRGLLLVSFRRFITHAAKRMINRNRCQFCNIRGNFPLRQGIYALALD